MRWPRPGICAKDYRRSSIVQVDWEDASGSTGWQDGEFDDGLVKVTSVGFLLHLGRRHLTLAVGLSSDGMSSARECIPRAWIKRVAVLRNGRR